MGYIDIFFTEGVAEKSWDTSSEIPATAVSWSGMHTWFYGELEYRVCKK